MEGRLISPLRLRHIQPPFPVGIKADIPTWLAGEKSINFPSKQPSSSTDVVGQLRLATSDANHRNRARCSWLRSPPENNLSLYPYPSLILFMAPRNS